MTKRASAKIGAALAATIALASAGCKPSAPAAAAPQKKYEAPEERFAFFVIAKTDMSADGYFSVGYVNALLDTTPSYHVLIVGHADQHGRTDANRELALKRARFVRKILVDHGIKENRILIAIPKETSSSQVTQLQRRVDMYVYDPLQDEATTRLGYPVDVKSE